MQDLCKQSKPKPLPGVCLQQLMLKLCVGSYLRSLFFWTSGTAFGFLRSSAPLALAWSGLVLGCLGAWLLDAFELHDS